MNTKYIITAFIIVIGLVASAVFFSSNKQPENKEIAAPVVEKEIDKSQHIYPKSFNETVTFAGQEISMSQNDNRERLEREIYVNTYWHSNTIQLIKLSQKYFPIIEPILAKNNVPDDFKYLAVAESGLRNVTSPAGAKGFWQFMKPAAKQYGLYIDSEVDERYHLEKATEAACKYLLNSKAKFGDWALAAAAYNAGEAGIQKQLNLQKETSYFNIILNPETERYVFRLIAMKEIIGNPDQHGFHIPVIERYHPFDYKEITVTGTVESWGNFAKEHHTNYRMLKLLNPWLRSDKLANKSSKTYIVKVP